VSVRDRDASKMYKKKLTHKKEVFISKKNYVLGYKYIKSSNKNEKMPNRQSKNILLNPFDEPI